MQTKEQIQEVARTWQMPAGFIDCDTNGIALAQCIQQHFGGVFTHANLDAAITKLGNKIAYNVRVVVEKAPTQTQEQVNKIFREWVKSYAPKNLILDGTNGTVNVGIINAYVKDYFAGVFSLTSLSEAANNAEGLKRLSADDIAAAAIAAARAKDKKDREHRLLEDAANRKERDHAKEVEEANAKAAKQKDAETRTKALIDGYQANGRRPGTIDYTLTETRKEEMRKIAVQHTDKVKAFDAVKVKWDSYPS